MDEISIDQNVIEVQKVEVKCTKGRNGELWIGEQLKWESDEKLVYE